MPVVRYRIGRWIFFLILQKIVSYKKSIMAHNNFADAQRVLQKNYLKKD